MKPVTNIAIIGEAWGEEEARQRSPFVGYSGHELTRMLGEAGIRRADCLLTNVFNLHPPGNKLEFFYGDPNQSIPGYPKLDKGWVRAEFKPELDRLAQELLAANPNVVILLGNTASWALLGRTAVSKHRGTTSLSTHTVSGFKCLPTYHPAAVTRQWELRPTTVLDLAKAARESAFPEIRRPPCEIWIEPTLEDIYEFEPHIRSSQNTAVDIETSGRLITCIGFSPRPSLGLVIPFMDQRRKNRCYWPDEGTERTVWDWVKSILGDRSIHKTFQNGLYDISFLWRAYGIPTLGATEDTMLLHHALQPESLKVPRLPRVDLHRPRCVEAHARRRSTQRDQELELMKIIKTHEVNPDDLSQWERDQVYNGLDCCVTAEVLDVLLPQLDNHTTATYDFSARPTRPAARDAATWRSRRQIPQGRSDRGIL